MINYNLILYTSFSSRSLFSASMISDDLRSTNFANSLRSIFRGGTASGPSILQLSSFTNKLMELLFPHPRIFDHFPNRTANDPSTILTVLVRNSACINILRSNHQIFLAQAIENAPSIPHICLKTRLQGQILVFPYRSNKKALKAELDRQNATSYQTCIVIAETLDDARKLNHFPAQRFQLEHQLR